MNIMWNYRIGNFKLKRGHYVYKMLFGFIPIFICKLTEITDGDRLITFTKLAKNKL